MFLLTTVRRKKKAPRLRHYGKKEFFNLFQVIKEPANVVVARQLETAALKEQRKQTNFKTRGLFKTISTTKEMNTNP